MAGVATISSQCSLVKACQNKCSNYVLYSKRSCCSSTLFKSNLLTNGCFCTLNMKQMKIGRKMANQFLEALDSWIPQNDRFMRGIPLFLGGSSIATILLNRALSGIAFVADASSGQSRADILSLALAVSVLLTGLIWKSIEPKEPLRADLQGVQCFNLGPELPTHLKMELQWVWEALNNGLRACALVIVYQGRCILQAGIASESPDFEGQASQVNVAEFLKGSLCRNVWASGNQSYLANLLLYPARFEMPFLPYNTQGVILQPLGDEGIMVVGSDRIRGFGPRDQAWIVTIAEKVDASLSKWSNIDC